MNPGIGPDDLLQITVFEAPEPEPYFACLCQWRNFSSIVGAGKSGRANSRQLELVFAGIAAPDVHERSPRLGFLSRLQSHPVSVVGAGEETWVFQIRARRPCSNFFRWLRAGPTMRATQS